MTTLRISSTTRLALNVTMVSLSVLLLVQSLGMFPDGAEAETDAHIAICESLAVNCSILAANRDLQNIETNLEALVSRNPHVLSAALRDMGGSMLASAGDHAALWNPKEIGHSDAAHIQVPISQGKEAWGQLEVRFAALHGDAQVLGITMPSWVRTVLVVTLLNGLLFMFYLRRMLRHLDPTKVVPNRVRAALDSLSEGLLVLDSQHRIVLANQAFQASVGHPAEELIGRTPAEFPWIDDSAMFWNSPENHDETPLTLNTEAGPRKFLVNCTEILDDKGAEQGSLVTFNDVTSLENNRARLMDAMVSLQKSRDKIQEQNQQLRVLATRDPLTNCWNRRAFFEELHNHWKASSSRDLELCVIMLDIDHFKGVNDNHGHAMGDRVLREVSATVLGVVRPTDYVCRYGGEEFCVLLPGATLEKGLAAAERFRANIEAMEFGELKVTASLGVSSIRLGGSSPEEMLEQADKSLYVAKRSGRNQVVGWSDVPADLEVDESKVSRVAAIEEHEPLGVPFQVVTSMLSALSFRDPDTAAHSMRVADLSFLIGQGLMSASDLYALEVGALLHDIGKIGVPDSILLKPGRLTDEEWKVMSRHARIGCEIVEAAFNCEAVENILRYYRNTYGAVARPGQLSGEAIPLGARIINIADAFDAMVSDQRYRKGRSFEEAYAELRRCAGTQFDPQLVDRFIDIMEAQPTDERRSATGVSTSKQLALQLGQSTDRIARAFDDQDFETLQAQAERLVETARKYDNQQIEQIATRLAKSAREDDEVSLTLAAVLELLEACRLTQHACLNQAEALRKELRHSH